MAIIKSEIADNSLQAHGQRYVREEHTDHLGKVHIVSYAAPGGANLTKIMNGRVPHVNLTLEQMEIREAIQRVENGECGFELEFTTWEAVKLAAIERETEYTKEIADLTNKKTELGKVE